MLPQAAYEELVRQAREAAVLDSCAELLTWDEETYMPLKGVTHRGNQMALLAGLHHERCTHPRIGELLAAVETSSLVADHESATAANMREWRRSYDRLTRLPRRLVEELARITSLAQQAWQIAHARGEFRRFRPWLEKVLVIKREEAECLGYADEPYDALLEDYEPGARTRQIAELFERLRNELVPLVQSVADQSRRTDAAVLRRVYPVAAQRKFARSVAEAVGFDFQRGRLDDTTHPFFSSIGSGDCRITTRYHEHEFGEGFFGMLHEVGHGLYEQGFDPAHFGTALAEAPSVAVHESQARLWENVVGRCRSFWECFFPQARQAFPEALGDVALDAFLSAVRHVEPTFIRVRADEVTYNLHILLRFDIERDLLTGSLKARELPGAWNEASRRYLGITPTSDLEGCLQDGHWSAGMIGYFPTYTLGNIMAAQLFARAQADLGELDAAFAQGDFRPLLEWLRQHVHRQGARYSATELVARVTGSAQDHRPLLRALCDRYLRQGK